MPRSLKPDDLKTGSGKRVPEKGTAVVLGGTGMAPTSDRPIGSIPLRGSRIFLRGFGAV